jgi:hypothetical protein
MEDSSKIHAADDVSSPSQRGRRFSLGVPLVHICVDAGLVSDFVMAGSREGSEVLAHSTLELCTDLFVPGCHNRQDLLPFPGVCDFNF